MRSLRVLPFIEEYDYWEPIMRECMGKVVFSECGV